MQATFAARGSEASSSSAQPGESRERSGSEQNGDGNSAAVAPRRVRPDLVEKIEQKTRWDGSVTQAIKKIYRRPVWTYTP